MEYEFDLEAIAGRFRHHPKQLRNGSTEVWFGPTASTTMKR